MKTAKERFQARAMAAFQERVARQKAARASKAHQPDSEEPESSPAPTARWERIAGTSGFQRVTTSLTGTDPDVDKVLLERYGHRLPAPEDVRQAEERLRDQLAHTGSKKVPLSERPDEVPNPRCPIDGVALETMSYSNSMKAAVRACPVCRRTEKQFVEKGVDLRSPTEALRTSMANGGITKKSTMTPVEQHVRSLTRRW